MSRTFNDMKKETQDFESMLSFTASSDKKPVSATSEPEYKSVKETKISKDMSVERLYGESIPSKVDYYEKPPALGGTLISLELKTFLEMTRVQSWASLTTLFGDDKTSYTDEKRFEYSKSFVNINLKELNNKLEATAENICFAKVACEVGISCFAKKNIKKGEFLLYGGITKKSENQANDAEYGIDFLGDVIDAEHHRDFGGWLAHLPENKPPRELFESDEQYESIATNNFTLQPLWVKDIQKLVPCLVALRDINEGEIIGWDYGQSYWRNFKTQPRFVTKQGSIVPVICFSLRVSMPGSAQCMEQVYSWPQIQNEVDKEGYFVFNIAQHRTTLVVELRTIRELLKKPRTSNALTVAHTACLTSSEFKIIGEALAKEFDTEFPPVIPFTEINGWIMNFNENKFIMKREFHKELLPAISKHLATLKCTDSIQILQSGNPDYCTLVFNSQTFYQLGRKLGLIEINRTVEIKERHEIKSIVQPLVAPKTEQENQQLAALPAVGQQPTMTNPQYVRFLQDSQDTTALAYLKRIFQLPFVGAVEEDDFLDAILPVENIETFVEVQNLIQARFELALPLRLQYAEDGKMQLVIPHINAENARAINAFTEGSDKKQSKEQEEKKEQQESNRWRCSIM